MLSFLRKRTNIHEKESEKGKIPSKIKAQVIFELKVIYSVVSLIKVVEVERINILQ